MQTKNILSTLFPFLKTAAAYSRDIQKQIIALPDKNEENFFGQALTAADLSIQALVEIVLLAHFPDIRFFGEEYEKSHNTPYFKGTTWGASDELLITLDPIDGTRYFTDKHDNFQIILSIYTPETFEGALYLSPARDHYFYALKGQGMFEGTISSTPFERANKLKLSEPPARVLLSSKVELKKPEALTGFEIMGTLKNYSPTEKSPMGNDLFFGELAGLVFGKASLIDAGAIAYGALEAGFAVLTFEGKQFPTPGHTKDLMSYPAIIAKDEQLAEKIVQSNPEGSLNHFS